VLAVCPKGHERRDNRPERRTCDASLGAVALYSQYFRTAAFIPEHKELNAEGASTSYGINTWRDRYS
jgi:hypothetical protein